MSSALGRGFSATGRPGPGRPRKRFAFSVGSLVLVKWEDGMVYFAKIKRIDEKREKCTVVFDDKSQDEADFSQIHSVDETTTDIICIKCKKDNSDSPNEIVLCDMCGIGFHQKCHNPPIPASALQPETPWNCCYCQRGTKCPFLSESLDVLQNLLSDNEATTGEEDEGGADSEYCDDTMTREDSTSTSRLRGNTRKRKGKRSYDHSAGNRQERKSLRLNLAIPESNLVSTERRSNHLLTRGEQHKASSGDLSATTPKAKLLNNSDAQSEATVSHRKRKRHHTGPNHQKRLKRSSVESRTVSVTRIDTPIYENVSTGLFLSPTRDRPALSPVLSSPEPKTVESHARNGLNKTSVSRSVSPATNGTPPKSKQRRFRVSLSLPDEIEKSVSAKSVVTTGTTFPPSWDNVGSPMSSERSPSMDKDSSFASPKPPLPPPPQVERPPEAEKPHVAFLASPLPTTSKKQLEVGHSKKVAHSPSPKHTGSTERTDDPKNTPVTKAAASPRTNRPCSQSMVVSKGVDVARKPAMSPVGVTTTTECSQPVPAAKVTGSSVNSGTDRRAGVTEPATSSPKRPVAASPFVLELASANSSGGEEEELPRGQVRAKSSAVDKCSPTCASTQEQPYLATSSQLDVGVTGKPRSAAVATNPVVISSIKVPATEERPKNPLSLTEKHPPASPPPPASPAVPSGRQGPQEQDETFIQYPSAGELAVDAETDQTAAARVTTGCGSQAATGTEGAAGQVSLEMAEEINSKPSAGKDNTLRSPSDFEPPSKSGGKATTPLEPNSIETAQQPKARPCALTKEQAASSSVVPPTTTNTRTCDSTARAPPTTNTSTAAPTSVITTTPPPRSLHLQRHSPDSSNKQLGKSERKEEAESGGPGPGRSRKHSAPTVTAASTTQQALVESKDCLQRDKSEIVSSLTQKTPTVSSQVQKSPVVSAVSTLVQKISTVSSPVTQRSVAVSTVLTQTQKTPGVLAASKAPGNPVGCKQSGSSASEPDVIITGIEPSSSRVKNSSHSATPAQGELDTNASSHTGQRQSQFMPVVLDPATGGSYTPTAAGGSSTAVCYHLPDKHGHGKPHLTRQLESPGSAPRTQQQHLPSSTVIKHPSGSSVYYQLPPEEAAAVVVKTGGGVAMHLSGVTTTKPYAIVNAIPTQSADLGYRSVPLPQKPTAEGGRSAGEGVGSPHSCKQQHQQQLMCVVSSAEMTHLVPGGGGGVGGGSVIQHITAPPSNPKTLDYPPPPYPTHLTERASASTPPKADFDLQSIQKKIGDAFSQSSEVMLVSAFEEAWAKFQANEKSYKEAKKEREKLSTPPKPESDKEVRTLSHGVMHHELPASAKPRPIAPKPSPSSPHPGTPLGQMAATTSTTKPRLIAPKPSSQQVLMSSAAPGHPGPGGPSPPQYVQVNGQQQQLVLQPVASDCRLPCTTVYAIPASAHGSKHQVHVTGLYYPAVESPDAPPKALPPPPPPPPPTQSDMNLASARQLPAGTAQHHHRRLVHHDRQVVGQPHSSTSALHLRGGPTTSQSSGGSGGSSQKSSKRCARCGKNATYLCSGCHLEWYCGRDCQLKSWGKHSDHCKA